MGAFLMGTLSAHAWLGGPAPMKSVPPTNLVVSVSKQEMGVYSSGGKLIKTYPVSTSKFGLSDQPGTYGTPLGLHEIVAKIGHGLPAGSVFKSRQPTGEVLPPNAPGRDPIVTRIMWLRGLEERNKNAYRRFIYIHGTPEERNIGRPVSYGCIRMKSKDVMELFNVVGIGFRLYIEQGALPKQVQPVLENRPNPEVQDSPPIYLGDQPNANTIVKKTEATSPSSPAMNLASNQRKSGSSRQKSEEKSAEKKPKITRKPHASGATILYSAD